MNSEKQDGASAFLKSFSDPDAVALYEQNMQRFLPGVEALHRMSSVLLAETAPQDATVLVLGAGGGLELRALAQARADWRFVGVDPAAEMLRMAERNLGGADSETMRRVDLVEGYIDDAPDGPFDAALCLLTLHFLPREERARTVAQIRQRLKPGAPFVAAHSCAPRAPEERARWLDRYAAYGVAAGAPPEMAKMARDAIEASGMMLSPEEDCAVLSEGGFVGVETFFQAFTWRGWICRAAPQNLESAPSENSASKFWKWRG